MLQANDWFALSVSPFTFISNEIFHWTLCSVQWFYRSLDWIPQICWNLTNWEAHNSTTLTFIVCPYSQFHQILTCLGKRQATQEVSKAMIDHFFSTYFLLWSHSWCSIANLKSKVFRFALGHPQMWERGILICLSQFSIRVFKELWWSKTHKSSQWWTSSLQTQWQICLRPRQQLNCYSIEKEFQRKWSWLPLLFLIFQASCKMDFWMAILFVNLNRKLKVQVWLKQLCKTAD